MVLFIIMEPDFGTYHHSTPEESRKTRESTGKAFTSVLHSLYPPDAEISILDAGCGLGFLTSIAAGCFPNARITAVDTFQHDSLSEASIERARSNMEMLGIHTRVDLRQHDLRTPLGSDEKFDAAISSLVFHNLGQERFSAYENVFNALKPGGFFVLGDLFPDMENDMNFFSELCNLLREEGSGETGKWSYRLFTLRKR